MKMMPLTQQVLPNQSCTPLQSHLRLIEPEQPAPRPRPSRLALWLEDEPGLVLAWQLLWLASWAAVLECVREWLSR